MTITVTDGKIETRTTHEFFVKEDSNSPYQGLLSYPADVYAAMTDDEKAAVKLSQFQTWKDNNAAMAAQAAAMANAVPGSISAIQAREAILAAGLKDQVEAVVAASDVATQNAWYGAVTLDRTNATVIALATAIGLSSDQLDDLFRQAAQL